MRQVYSLPISWEANINENAPFSFADQQRSKIYNRRRLLILVGILSFLVFVASTLFGDSGILANLQIKKEYRKLRVEQADLTSENDRLRKELRELKTNPRKIEEIGRTEFGYGRPGEVVFLFPEDKSQPIQKSSIEPEEN